MTSKVKSIQEAGLGHSFFQREAEQTLTFTPRHTGIIHAEEKPSKKKGVCSFAQVLRLNSNPGKDKLFLQIVEKIFMPEKRAKSTFPSETSPLAE